MKESGPDDAALIALVAQAQLEAFNILYDRYNRLVFSVALAVLGDRTLAEEATLDAFVHVWRRAGTYRAEKGALSTWLIAITRHRAIDILRWYGSRPEALSLDWDVTAVRDGPDRRGPEERVEISLRRARVREAVAQLPPDQRQALALAFFKGYSHRQIAEILNQPLGTVKTRIRLAMQKLHEVLSED